MFGCGSRIVTLSMLSMLVSKITTSGSSSSPHASSSRRSLLLEEHDVASDEEEEEVEKGPEAVAAVLVEVEDVETDG
jgi:hypothetical protein